MKRICLVDGGNTLLREVQISGEEEDGTINAEQ